MSAEASKRRRQQRAAAMKRWRDRQISSDPDTYRAKRNAHRRKWQDENKAKHNAHNRVYRAVKSGVLVRPDNCAVCGVRCKPEASHDDYSRPLDVEWLCRACHAAKDFPINPQPSLTSRKD